MELIESSSIVLKFKDANNLPYSESFTITKYRDDKEVFFGLPLVIPILIGLQIVVIVPLVMKTLGRMKLR